MSSTEPALAVDWPARMSILQDRSLNTLARVYQPADLGRYIHPSNTVYTTPPMGRTKQGEERKITGKAAIA